MTPESATCHATGRLPSQIWTGNLEASASVGSGNDISLNISGAMGLKGPT